MYVLMAGLAIFVVGGLLAGYAEEGGIGTGQTGDAIFSEALGVVGGTGDAAPRTAVELSDVTVEPRAPNRTVVSGETVTTRSSITGGTSGIVEFSAEQPETAYISFVPTQAADPDQLTVTVNGASVDVPAVETGQRVRLSVTDALQAGNNIVEFRAEQPGVAGFWKRPQYTLENVEVVLHDRSHSRVVEPFRVYDYEITGFDHGEISYSVTEDAVATRPLRVAINGRPVMDRYPQPRAAPYTATFFANSTGLHPGENTISFSTAGDARYTLQNARVTLTFYAGTQRRTVVRDFNLSGSQYGRLSSDGGGVMRFYVERILQPAPVEFGLTNRSYTRQPTAGTNTITFGKNAVVKGQNTLRISTTGSYRISQFNVTVPEQ